MKSQMFCLLLLMILAFCLRFFRAGVPVLKEEENSTVTAAAYVYHCRQDSQNCLYTPRTSRSKFLALITGNETVPNSLAEIYVWNFITKAPVNVHSSRAWPHLYAQAAVYKWLGINELSSRLVSVVAGSLLVVAGYWFSRVLGGSIPLSLLYSGLLAIAFPLIDVSRNARMYSLYILIFMILVGFIYRSRWWLSIITFLLAYWLQLLTSILPVAILVWATMIKRHRLTAALLFGLIGLIGLTAYSQVDFFHLLFLKFTWPPHWEYFSWWWIGAITVAWLMRQQFLLAIILTYWLVLMFFSRPAPANAYLVALWPLTLWVWLNYRRWLTVLVTLIVIADFAGKINYLYFGRDNRAQIQSAYAVVKNNFIPGDKFFAIQLRDYYLQDLPPETQVTDLQKNPYPQFSGSGWVVWEQEKTGHFQPSVLAYVKNNFEHLAGEGIDNFGVEIYSFGK